MWCHGTVAELLGEAGLCRCARMPDAAYVQVTDCYWRRLLKKSFGGGEYVFRTQRCEGTTSLPRKTTRDLRIGATEYPSVRVVQRSTIARFS